MTPMMVMPSRPATSREALNTAEAMPAQSAGMLSRSVQARGIVSPLSMPKIAKPGIRSAKVAWAPSRPHPRGAVR